jgi:hypothetical protein
MRDAVRLALARVVRLTYFCEWRANPAQQSLRRHVSAVIGGRGLATPRSMLDAATFGARDIMARGVPRPGKTN